MTAITPDFVDDLRSKPHETHHLEFKTAGNHFDKEKARDYCVAIANEGGGFLVLGVSDKLVGGLRPVVGTQAFLKLNDLELYLLNECGFRVAANEVVHSDGRVLVLSIPGRPKGVPLAADGKYLMRVGESLVPMTQDRLKQIFDENAPHWGEEPCGAPVSASRVVELLDTQAFFELLKQPYPTNRQGVIEGLQRSRLILPDDGGFAIRRLGALLLAKKLEDFSEVARHAARVVVYSGTNKLETRMDRPGVRGYASGFRGLVKFIMEQMPRREVVENALRRDETLVPEIMIRELVANALVHQDLTITGTSPMIEIYTDRIEISNPGEPIVQTDRFIDGYQSRNEHLAELMRLFGICEEKGSGIDRVITAAEQSHLSAPHISAGANRTHVIIFGPRDFGDMISDERIRAAYQHCALKWVSRDHMTNQSLRVRFRLPDSRSAAVSQVITATTDAGLVKLDKAVGESKKYARYLPYWA
jgi:predicted HTH transcriptional regulator